VIAGLAAVILAVAAVIVLAVRPSAQEITYTGMPAPCQILTTASLARYLPDATGKAQGESVRGARVDMCTWDSEAGGQNRLLSATVVIYESSASLSDAQSEYQTFISDESGIMGKGDTVTTRRVADLGNQAVSVVVTGHNPSPGEILVPQVGLVVQAGNAVIWLNYATASVGTPAQLTPPPPIAEQVAATIAMARHVLAALTR
jgi:ATP:corrinoid adenosyltransferase